MVNCTPHNRWNGRCKLVWKLAGKRGPGRVPRIPAFRLTWVMKILPQHSKFSAIYD